jgi:glutathione S-transferase
MLAEYGVAVDLVEAKPWLRDPAFIELNPAASLPVLLDGGDIPAAGVLATIHAIEGTYAPASVAGLVPAEANHRAEMWRLVEWVLFKFNDEVTRYLIEEKIAKRDIRGSTPDTSALRAAKANLGEHLQYFNWLCASRHWLAGDAVSLADFALAAHLSSLDYMGDVSWEAAPDVKDWYARVKSRPAFRTLLGDRVTAMPPSKRYADLDF